MSTTNCPLNAPSSRSRPAIGLACSRLARLIYRKALTSPSPGRDRARRSDGHLYIENVNPKEPTSTANLLDCARLEQIVREES